MSTASARGQFGMTVLGFAISLAGFPVIGMGVMLLGAELFPPDAEVKRAELMGIPFQTSQVGIPITKVYGTRDVKGNVLYLGNLVPYKRVESTSSGGKGGGAETETEYYEYTMTMVFGLAIGNCTVNSLKIDGEITSGITSTADMYTGKVTVSNYTVYDGTQTTADADFISVLTADGFTRFPVYKGFTYVVFHNYNVGEQPVVPQFTFNITSGTSDITDISYDVLTNQQYGLGLNPALLDSTSFASTQAYCDTIGFNMNCVYSSQFSVLDILADIAAHHDGFFSYIDGKIAHNQIKPETPKYYIDVDDMIRDTNNSQFTISTKKQADFINKVTTSYSKPDFKTGTVTADDPISIEQRGVNSQMYNLFGITDYDTASKITNLLLAKGLANTRAFTFGLPREFFDLNIGDVIQIYAPNRGIKRTDVRIMSAEEGEYGEVMVTCVEEFNLSGSTVVTGTEPVYVPPFNNIAEAPVPVNDIVIFELPRMYSTSPKLVLTHSGVSSGIFGGTALWKSYEEAQNYFQVSTSTTYEFTGVVTDVGVNTDNSIAYITVLSLSTDTLSSALTFDALMADKYKNLFVVKTADKDVYIRFGTATLVDVGEWELTDLVYDTTRIPQLNTYGEIDIGDKVGVYNAFVEPPYILDIKTTELYRTLWYKMPSVNGIGESEDLSTVVANSIYISNLNSMPNSPTDYMVNGFSTTGGVSVSSSDITITWVSSNASAVNFDSQTRTDLCIDDAEFDYFQIEILDINDILIRQATSTIKSWVYTTAMQTADGLNQFKVRVVQNNLSQGSIDNEISGIITRV